MGFFHTTSLPLRLFSRTSCLPLGNHRLDFPFPIQKEGASFKNSRARSSSGQTPSRFFEEDRAERLAPQVIPSKRGLLSKGVSLTSAESQGRTDLSLISNDVELEVLPQPVHSEAFERYKGPFVVVLISLFYPLTPTLTPSIRNV